MHMSAKRVHLVLAAEEAARYRAAAAAEGVTLSAWLRDAAARHLDDTTDAPLDTPEDLDAFFEASDQAEEGDEPDWDEHLAVLTASRAPSQPPS